MRESPIDPYQRIPEFGLITVLCIFHFRIFPKSRIRGILRRPEYGRRRAIPSAGRCSDLGKAAAAVVLKPDTLRIFGRGFRANHGG